tara:strand:- start:1321 stop:1518 length:198 start_codon:yes stop_codon:yes gene_type:complete
MKILNEAQIEQLLEVTRKGNPVAGTALFKIATDLRRLRRFVVRLVENKDDQEEIDKIVEEAVEYL